MQIFVTPTKSCYNIYRKTKGTSESERTREREEELKKKNRNHDSVYFLVENWYFLNENVILRSEIKFVKSSQAT